MAWPSIGLWSKNANGSPALAASANPSYIDFPPYGAKRRAAASTSSATASITSFGALVCTIRCSTSRIAPATRKSAARRGVGSISRSFCIAAAQPAAPGVVAVMSSVGGSASRHATSSRSTIEGRVVRRQLALAGVAVDQRPAHPLGERRRPEHEVDAHADALVEVPGPVVPPREQAVGVGVAVAEDVGEPPVEQLLQRRPLGRAHVGDVHQGGGVPNVAIGGGDVEVAAQRDRLGWDRRRRRGGPPAVRASAACTGSARGRGRGRSARRRSSRARHRRWRSAGGPRHRPAARPRTRGRRPRARPG